MALCCLLLLPLACQTDRQYKEPNLEEGKKKKMPARFSVDWRLQQASKHEEENEFCRRRQDHLTLFFGTHFAGWQTVRFCPEKKRRKEAVWPLFYCTIPWTNVVVVVGTNIVWHHSVPRTFNVVAEVERRKMVKRKNWIRRKKKKKERESESNIPLDGYLFSLQFLFL